MDNLNPTPATPIQQAAPPDPWTVKDQPQVAPVPAGMYLGRFSGVATKTLAADGPRWRWAWAIQSGEYAGREATALTGMDIHPASHAGALVAGLLGRPVHTGENVRQAVEACVGRSYLLSVQPGPKGGKPAVRSVGTPPAM